VEFFNNSHIYAVSFPHPAGNGVINRLTPPQRSQQQGGTGHAIRIVVATDGNFFEWRSRTATTQTDCQIWKFL